MKLTYWRYRDDAHLNTGWHEFVHWLYDPAALGREAYRVRFPWLHIHLIPGGWLDRACHRYDRRHPTAHGLPTPAASVTVTLTVTVTAPTRRDGRIWAETLADLIRAEHGHHMRLSTRIDDEPADNVGP